jgi:hypothetical protein
MEYNRNFHPNQAYTTTYMPGEAWPGTCYFGASGLAFERLMHHFGYSLVAFDHAGACHLLAAPPPPPPCQGRAAALVCAGVLELSCPPLDQSSSREQRSCWC